MELICECGEGGQPEDGPHDEPGEGQVYRAGLGLGLILWLGLGLGLGLGL